MFSWWPALGVYTTLQTSLLSYEVSTKPKLCFSFFYVFFVCKGNISRFYFSTEKEDWLVFITRTCLYNSGPLKPHFYIVKLGLTGVFIIFLISAQKCRLWVLVRTASPRRGGSNGYPQSMFWAEILKISEFLSKNFHFLVENFSVYLNRRAFVMLFCHFISAQPSWDLCVVYMRNSSTAQFLLINKQLNKQPDCINIQATGCSLITVKRLFLAQ